MRYRSAQEKKRERRECRVPGRTRSLVCNCRKHTSVVTADEAETPTFPARWFDRLWRALPGVHDLLVTVALRNVSQDLAPAQGCQDHTLLRHGSTSHVLPCAPSTASRTPRLVTIGRTPLCIEAGCAYNNHAFLKNETNLIFQKAEISLDPSGKSVPWRPTGFRTALTGRQQKC